MSRRSFAPASAHQGYAVLPRFKPGKTVYCEGGLFGLSRPEHLIALRRAQADADAEREGQTIHTNLLERKQAIRVEPGRKGRVLAAVRDKGKQAHWGTLVEVQLEDQSAPIWAKLGSITYDPPGSAAYEAALRRFVASMSEGPAAAEGRARPAVAPAGASALALSRVSKAP